ncbi:urease accessory protein UreH domain-containing protein [Gelatiniphilus marinus]|uniref:Sulfite exporter TauE/SafE family protein n=1 Tax=Gelatiniphilus marinus TaxID=1759464 RepID=A0ABW5JV48_9FLAO
MDAFPLFTGISAAILHVIAGPDHLAAVAPFAIERVKKAWKVGLLWGIGHLSGMLIIGMLFLFFKDLIPIEKISVHSEKFVGVILFLLGLWILVKIFRANKKVHKHLHVHADENVIIHKHGHQHEGKKNHAHSHTNIKQSNISTLFIGLVHGLAGIAHFLLFLPVLGFTSKSESIYYIGGFAIGTLLAMSAFAFVMGQIASFSKKDHNDSFFKGIRIASALFAMLFGVYWIIAN